MHRDLTCIHFITHVDITHVQGRLEEKTREAEQQEAFIRKLESDLRFEKKALKKITSNMNNIHLYQDTLNGGTMS